jgi:hypothetical protein
LYLKLFLKINSKGADESEEANLERKCWRTLVSTWRLNCTWMPQTSSPAVVIVWKTIWPALPADEAW